MIVSSYSFIDANTGDYQEEEVFYQEEEEENFDHPTNQGKLTIADHHDAKLYLSKAPSHFNFYVLPIPCFYLAIILLIYFQSTFWFMIHLV